jgi:hypothetical protein
MVDAERYWLAYYPSILKMVDSIPTLVSCHYGIGMTNHTLFSYHKARTHSRSAFPEASAHIPHETMAPTNMSHDDEGQSAPGWGPLVGDRDTREEVHFRLNLTENDKRMSQISRPRTKQRRTGKDSHCVLKHAWHLHADSNGTWRHYP